MGGGFLIFGNREELETERASLGINLKQHKKKYQILLFALTPKHVLSYTETSLPRLVDA